MRWYIAVSFFVWFFFQKIDEIPAWSWDRVTGRFHSHDRIDSKITFEMTFKHIPTSPATIWAFFLWSVRRWDDDKNIKIKKTSLNYAENEIWKSISVMLFTENSAENKIHDDINSHKEKGLLKAYVEGYIFVSKNFVIQKRFWRIEIKK